MNAQDGEAWLVAQYAAKSAENKAARKITAPAKSAGSSAQDSPGTYHTKVYHADVPVDLVLLFKKYESRTTINLISGRVTGSTLVAKEEQETLLVPAGTDVCLFRPPFKAGRGETVAVFFFGDKQVSYKRDMDLVHKVPSFA